MNKSEYNSLYREEKIQFLKKYRFENADARDTVSFLVRMIGKRCGKLNRLLDCEKAAEKILVEGIVAYFIMKEDDSKTYIEVSTTNVTTFEFNGQSYYLDMNTIGGFVLNEHSSMTVANREDIIVLLYNWDNFGGLSFLDEMYTGKLDKNDLMNESIIDKVVNIIHLVDKIATRRRKIEKLFQ